MDEKLQAAIRETLALIGYVDPLKGWGIRVLSIDGGGTRYRHSTKTVGTTMYIFFVVSAIVSLFTFTLLKSSWKILDTYGKEQWVETDCDLAINSSTEGSFHCRY